MLLKKYGPKAAKKVKKIVKDKDLLQLEYKKKSPPTGNINKAKTPSVILQGNKANKLKQAKEKVNNSKQVKNLNLSFEDKQKVIRELAKGDNKTLANAFTQVLRKPKVNKTITKTKTDKPKVNKTTTKTKTDKTYNLIDPKTGRITGAAKKVWSQSCKKS